MKKLTAFGLAIGVLASLGTLRAEELKSGPQPGETIGAFTVEKVCGNADDGVDEGKKLCYRCKLGSRPVVAVFARKADDSVAELMKQLDSIVADNQDKKAASFVNLLGTDMETLKKGATKLVEKAKAKNIAVVVPIDGEDRPEANGPKNLLLNAEADLTVLIYKNGTIEANYALGNIDKLDKKMIKAIVSDTEKMLN